MARGNSSHRSVGARPPREHPEKGGSAALHHRRAGKAASKIVCWREGVFIKNTIVVAEMEGNYHRIHQIPAQGLGGGQAAAIWGRDARSEVRVSASTPTGRDLPRRTSLGRVLNYLQPCLKNKPDISQAGEID